MRRRLLIAALLILNLVLIGMLAWSAFGTGRRAWDMIAGG